MTLAPMSPNGKKERLDEIFDPRLVGTVVSPFALLKHEHLESVVGSVDRDPPKLRRETWKGKDCWVVSFHNNVQVYLEFWVVPSLGNSVVRNIIKPSSEKLVTQEIEVAPVGNTGLWFPRSYVYEVLNKGKVDEREEFRVTKVSLNESIDEKVFTLAGMNIAPDTTLACETPDGQSQTLTWTGAELVNHVNPTFVKRPPPTSSRSWLVPLAVGAALIAIAALALYWRGSRARRPAV